MTIVLVIEDEEPLRANLQTLLEAEDLRFLGAPDGHAGVELARRHLPDLILCDIMMPGLDGFGVLELLRQNPLTATIPFIFLTARGEKSDLRRGMETGADDYLTKPFTRDEVLNAIAARLARQAGAERKLRDKLDELRASIAMSLPHELRTPLTGIQIGTALLKDEFDRLKRDEIAGLVEIMDASAARLQRLAANYSLYAELEQAAATPRQASVSPGEAANPEGLVAYVAVHSARQARREADLRLEIGEGTVMLSEVHLHKIAEELLDNAFKFSEAGSAVSVTGALCGARYTLSVVDHGRGMTAEQIAGIGAYLQFERKLHEQQGSGLGLTIARRLAELYGGELRVESDPGRRTCVQVILPGTAAEPCADEA